MKKTILSPLALLAVLSIAGITFAAQPAAQVEEPVVSTPAPATDDTAAPDLLNEIFQDPVEAGACCMADCLSERTACWDFCGADTACREQCNSQYNACTSHC